MPKLLVMVDIHPANLDGSLQEFYVYLYREPVTRGIRYVGKGTRTRAQDHLKGAQNPRFRAWIEQLKDQGKVPVVEILPAESEASAFRIEAALISALWTGSVESTDVGLVNKVGGHGVRFRPLGLPEKLDDRHWSGELTRDALAAAGGAIVVYIGNDDFSFERRRGARPQMHLSDADIRSRMEKWWQLGELTLPWRQSRDLSPRILVGVTGPTAARTVWGSCWIDTSSWEKTVATGGPSQYRDGSLVRIPLRGTTVDAAALRGKRVAKGELGPLGEPGRRRFGSWTTQFCDVVPAISDEERSIQAIV